MKLPTMKRNLPEVFTDEDNYFGKNQAWIATWRSSNNCVTQCIISTMPANYLKWWWTVPILNFVGLIMRSVTDAIEYKAGIGY